MEMRFFDKLFADDIEWSFHTSMTCDLLYVMALALKQMGFTSEKKTIKENELARIGVFYQPNPEKKRTLTFRGSGRRLRVDRFKSIVHEITDLSQTYHAKISLVAYKKNPEGKRHYRLAVYSKNLEFDDSCFETAVLYDLVNNGDIQADGIQLVKYIEKIKSNTDKTGQEWISNHVDSCMEELKTCSISEDNSVSLHFGGVDLSDSTLGQSMLIDKVGENSIVLTPPEFIRDTAAANFFGDIKILYDIKKDNEINRTSSHAKLYLLEKENQQQKVYELWHGSANASKNGIGWDFCCKNVGKSVSNEKIGSIAKNGIAPSVECLVKHKLSKEQFQSLRESIQESFEVFDFDSGEKGSLTPVIDDFGPWIVSNYQVKSIYYADAAEQPLKNLNRESEFKGKAKSLCITLESKSPKKQEKQPEITQMWLWRPAEYADLAADSIEMREDGTILLKYAIESFRPSQGMLCFGVSQSVMWIPDDKMKNIPHVPDTVDKDTRLTDWLIEGRVADDIEDDDPLKEIFDFLKNLGDKL